MRIIIAFLNLRRERRKLKREISKFKSYLDYHKREHHWNAAVVAYNYIKYLEEKLAILKKYRVL